MIPISYQIPLLLSSKTVLEEANFDITKATDFKGFLNQLIEYESRTQRKGKALFDRLVYAVNIRCMRESNLLIMIREKLK